MLVVVVFMIASLASTGLADLGAYKPPSRVSIPAKINPVPLTLKTTGFMTFKTTGSPRLVPLPSKKTERRTQAKKPPAPKPTSVPVDPDTVQIFETYLKYAMAAYSFSVNTLRKWKCTGCCDGLTQGTQVINSFGLSGKPQAYGSILINHNKINIIVTIRGTHTIPDILTDIDLKLENFDTPPINYTIPRRFFIKERNITLTSSLRRPSTVQVHSGIQKYYQTARKKIQGTLYHLSRRYHKYTIAFTGHSLGGSIACLAALDFVNLNGIHTANRISVYTFGQPRTGNLAFANYFNSIPFAGVYRITRQKDLVPHVPPLEFGYVHIAQEYGIDKDGMVHTCHNIGKGGETSNCQNKNFWWPMPFMHLKGYFGQDVCLD